MLDVVDLNDIVIGAQSRDEVHRRSLIHRASHMLLFNSRQELFLQKRSQSKDVDPGLWDSSAAGHVDSGESYMDCAVRELQEELGLYVTPADLTEQFKLPPIPATGMEFSITFTVVSDQPLVLDPVEVETGCWSSIEKIDEWLEHRPEELSVAFSLIWQRIRADLAQRLI